MFEAKKYSNYYRKTTSSYFFIFCVYLCVFYVTTTLQKTIAKTNANVTKVKLGNNCALHPSH
jgi:hypothetical protein